jgi:hypothetical protein
VFGLFYFHISLDQIVDANFISSSYAIPHQAVMNLGIPHGNPNGHGLSESLNGHGMGNGHDDDGAFAQQLS